MSVIWSNGDLRDLSTPGIWSWDQYWASVSHCLPSPSPSDSQAVGRSDQQAKRLLDIPCYFGGLWPDPLFLATGKYLLSTNNDGIPGSPDQATWASEGYVCEKGSCLDGPSNIFGNALKLLCSSYCRCRSSWFPVRCGLIGTGSVGGFFPPCWAAEMRVKAFVLKLLRLRGKRIESQTRTRTREREREWAWSAFSFFSFFFTHNHGISQ